MCAQRRLRPAWAIRPVWLESSLSAWRKLWPLATHWAQAKTLIRLGGCPGWSESSLGAHAISFVLSWGGSYFYIIWTICIWLRMDSTIDLRIEAHFWNHSWVTRYRNELPHDKTNKMACASSEDSDQPGEPHSLIRVFAVRMKKAWVLSYPLSAQQRVWSDRADTQADLSLHWSHRGYLLVLSWGGSNRPILASWHFYPNKSGESISNLRAD